MTDKMDLGKPTIVVDRLTKVYRSKGQKQWSPQRRTNSHSSIEVNALSDVTFIARRGESIGVIGQNGSGKSTLFRIMSGKDTPTSGTILVSSEPSLLGVAAAMQRHLTGIQNIELGCLAMGMKKTEIKEAIEDIKKFCDIGDAIYRPLATYSSGMSARLKFAIATSVRPEILLVDEALSTGDAAFNARATERMRTFLDGSGTVLVVSHSAKALRDICTRAIWLHLGEVIADSSLDEVAKLYDEWSRTKAKGEHTIADKIVASAKNSYFKSRVKYV